MNIEDLNAELTKLKDEKYHLLKLINHDIRSPFNRIFALLQLFEMESGELNKQQKEYLDSMYLSILSGLEMIQNLRDMREIDAGNIETEQTDIDLSDVIRKSVRTFSKQTELKNITIILEGVEEEIVLKTDEYYIQRVVENILSNAVKFSKRGKNVQVNLCEKEKDLEISIQDFGEGIKTEEEHLLFQKFKKLSSNASGGEGCLGLGLHNSHYFMKKLGGTIRLVRKQNQGSTFVVSLPKS